MRLRLVLLVLAVGGAGCSCDPQIERETDMGLLRGTVRDGVEAYRGIRYGVAPAGAARWQVAVPPPAAEVIDATAWAPACAQREIVLGTYTGADDCLALNVFVREGAAAGDDRPVLFFVHGGGNVSGASSESVNGTPTYDGYAWPRDEDVVLVTTNYRLGPFGFLADAEVTADNLGLRDQIAALRWVRDHIAELGGDPERVLIFGESAGGQDVCALLASPLAQGLFKTAVVQSGSCLQPDRAARVATSESLLDALDCGDFACVSEKSSRQIALALPRGENTSELSAGLNAWGPYGGSEVLPDSPHRRLADATVARVPFILGTNGAEHALFPSGISSCADYEAKVTEVLEDAEATVADVLGVYPCPSDAQADAAWGQLYDDVRFHCPAALVTAGARAHGTLHRYRNDRGRDRGLLAGQGAFHGAELGMQFDTHTNMTEAEHAYGRELRRIWAAFARDGVPPEDLEWPAYDDSEPLLVLDDRHALETAFRADACAFWADRLPLR